MELTASHGSMVPRMQRGISGMLPTHGSQLGARAPREAWQWRMSRCGSKGNVLRDWVFHLISRYKYRQRDKDWIEIKWLWYVCILGFEVHEDSLGENRCNTTYWNVQKRRSCLYADHSFVKRRILVHTYVCFWPTHNLEYFLQHHWNCTTMVEGLLLTTSINSLYSQNRNTSQQLIDAKVDQKPH